MRHLAIIADGNRRWAQALGLSPKLGHTQGLTVIERCCSWALDNELPFLTVYCFSTENWKRS
jgi:undecaprenyl diphosphate synthase